MLYILEYEENSEILQSGKYPYIKLEPKNVKFLLLRISFNLPFRRANNKM